MTEDELRRICIKEIPLQFYKGMAEGIDGVYKEADALAYKTPSWAAEQGDYIAPHLRLILFENLFAKSAASAGMIAVPTENVSKNYSYTLARVNRLVLTASSVEGRQELPRNSVFRNQLCEMNDFLSRPVLPFISQLHPQQLYARNEIYGILLHGKSYIKTNDGKWVTDAGKYGFLRLAFMNTAMDAYVANFDFFELYTQALLNLTLTNPNDLEDRARPKLKDRDIHDGRKDKAQ